MYDIIIDFYPLEEKKAMRNAIGIDIGGTNIKVAIVTEEWTILNTIIEPTPTEREGTFESIKNKLIEIVKGICNDDVIGIGFGIAGIIDREKGIVISSPNIPLINGFRVKDIFEKEFSLPVEVDNDANAFAFGEKLVGSGKDFNNFIVLTLGTGLGSGVIYKGEIFEGAVEAGHIVIEPEGRFCTCGGFGCLESYASGRAVVDRVISSLEKGAESILRGIYNGNFYKITPEIVYKTALEGDTLCREVFRETGRYLGIGIANLVNLFSPEAVIIGGGLVGAWEMFIEELKREFFRRAIKSLSARVKILKASSKEGISSVGAAGLIFKTAKQTIISK